MARHVEHQPLTNNSRSNLPSKGFELLTKDSRSNPLTNCTIMGPWGKASLASLKRRVIALGVMPD
jgi:hypothetical protein